MEEVPRNNLGLSNEGTIIRKNRAWRRARRNTAQLEGKPKNYYTTKQTHTRRKKNGKVVKVRKKSSK